MEYFEPFTNMFLKKELAYNKDCAEELFNDIKDFLVNKEFSSAAEEVMYYEEEVCGYELNELSFSQKDVEQYLTETFNSHPFTLKDIDNYEKSEVYEMVLANQLINYKIAVGNTALKIAHLIKYDLMKADVKSAAETIQKMLRLKDTQELTLKLGKIASKLIFAGESENELDDY